MRNSYILSTQLGEKQKMIIRSLQKSDKHYLLVDFDFVNNERHFISDFVKFKNRDLHRLLWKGVLKVDFVHRDRFSISIFYCLTELFKDLEI